MAPRILALFVALTTGAVGAIPSVPWQRCLWTHQRMAPGHECQPRCARDDAAATVTTPCCEQVAALALEMRATNATPDKTISPPTVVALLSFAWFDPGGALASRQAAADRRGRPPDDHRERFSAILRI